MLPFNPNFNDSITTTDDVVMFLIIIAIYVFVMFLCQAVIDSVYLIRANRTRKKLKREHQFPKYLEDDDE